MLEVLNGGVRWEELVPHKEDKVREGPELDCSAVAGALSVFTRYKAEVEARGDHIGNLTGFGVG